MSKIIIAPIISTLLQRTRYRKQQNTTDAKIHSFRAKKKPKTTVSRNNYDWQIAIEESCQWVPRKADSRKWTRDREKHCIRAERVRSKNNEHIKKLDMAFIIGLHIGNLNGAFILALECTSSNIRMHYTINFLLDTIKYAFFKCNFFLCWWSIASSLSSDNRLIMEWLLPPGAFVCDWISKETDAEESHRRIQTDSNERENGFANAFKFANFLPFLFILHSSCETTFQSANTHHGPKFKQRHFYEWLINWWNHFKIDSHLEENHTGRNRIEFESFGIVLPIPYIMPSLSPFISISPALEIQFEYKWNESINV